MMKIIKIQLSHILTISISQWFRQGYFCSQRDIWQCLETFLPVTADIYEWGPGLLLNTYNIQDSLQQQRVIQSKMSIVLRRGNPGPSPPPRTVQIHSSLH